MIDFDEQDRTKTAREPRGSVLSIAATLPSGRAVASAYRMIEPRKATFSGHVRPVCIQWVGAREMREVITPLTDTLVEAVNEGLPLGFTPPIARESALLYWISVRQELETGARLLLVATYENRVVGSAQLALSQSADSLHRAEVERLFVAPTERGHGVGTALMEATEDLALANGRSLLTISTRYSDAAHHWFRTHRYQQVGVVPGWTKDANGEEHDHVLLYKNLSER